MKKIVAITMIIAKLSANAQTFTLRVMNLVGKQPKKKYSTVLTALVEICRHNFTGKIHQSKRKVMQLLCMIRMLQQAAVGGIG